MTPTPSAPRRPSRVWPLGLLDAISSIWFGVAMLVIIFIYACVGSAVPPIRQGAMADWTGLEFLRFEKSEMEWFGWWPFQAMIALFCVAMVLATFRRIRFNLPNFGIWMTHAGIIMLAVSSAYYFGTKVEGDAVVFQSRALILAGDDGARHDGGPAGSLHPDRHGRAPLPHHRRPDEPRLRDPHRRAQR